MASISSLDDDRRLISPVELTFKETVALLDLKLQSFSLSLQNPSLNSFSFNQISRLFLGNQMFCELLLVSNSSQEASNDFLDCHRCMLLLHNHGVLVEPELF